MKEPPVLMVRLYRMALAAYPLRLRLEYREQMLRTLRDAYGDRNTGVLRFWAGMFGDLLESSMMQRFDSVVGAGFEKPVMYHTVVLAVILSLLGGTAVFVIDQMMRVGEGNQPQMEMADWYAGEISAGVAPEDIIPPGYVDLENSLQPFVIFYDDQGRPVKGTGYLDQKLQAPPAGVFDFVRSNGLEKVTWQPQRGVRMATVIRRVDIKGKPSGFVLAGRSLRLVERQKSILWRMALGIWLTMMLLLIGGASLVRRAQRASQAHA